MFQSVKGFLALIHHAFLQLLPNVMKWTLLELHVLHCASFGSFFIFIWFMTRSSILNYPSEHHPLPCQQASKPDIYLCLYFHSNYANQNNALWAHVYSSVYTGIVLWFCTTYFSQETYFRFMFVIPTTFRGFYCTKTIQKW